MGLVAGNTSSEVENSGGDSLSFLSFFLLFPNLNRRFIVQAVRMYIFASKYAKYFNRTATAGYLLQ